MFKKDENKSPESREGGRPPARVEPPAPPEGNRGVAVIGRSIIVKGEVTGQENLIVEGTIEGRIHLQDHHVIIAPTGQVQAEVEAKMVTIEGQVTGNVHAAEKVILTKEGSLTGDIQAARLKVEDGAYLKGTVSLSPREKEKAIPLAKVPFEPVESKSEEAAGG